MPGCTASAHSKHEDPLWWASEAVSTRLIQGVDRSVCSDSSLIDQYRPTGTLCLRRQDKCRARRLLCGEPDEVCIWQGLAMLKAVPPELDGYGIRLDYRTAAEEDARRQR